MADNVTISEGSGTTIATDDVGGTHYQIVKVAHGAADSATQSSSANPFPTTLSNLEQAEDSGHTTGDSGVMLLAVRKDTATALAGTDADYIPLIVDASGRLHVAQSGVEKTDDASFTAGTSKVIPAGAVYQSSVDEVDANDAGATRMTARRALLTAADFKKLSLTPGAPVPTGSDIVELSDAAIQASDLTIRDTNQHYFFIPMTSSGYKNIAISVANDSATAWDQTPTIKLYVATQVGSTRTGSRMAPVLSVTQDTTANYHMFFTNQGAVGQGGQAGDATATFEDYYSVPALVAPFIALNISFGTSPTQGEFDTIFISRWT